MRIRVRTELLCLRKMEELFFISEEEEYRYEKR